MNRRTSASGNSAAAPKDSDLSTVAVNALNQYTSVNGQAFTHDPNGNQTQGLTGNNSYTATWDARDRLVSLSRAGFTASFTYDALGRRTSRTVNGQQQTYLYDGSDIISETGSKNAIYTHGPGIDEPLLRKATGNEYYLSDILGSVIALTDDTGTIQTSYNYSPYGKKQTTGFASDSAYGFTAREDDGTGFYYYRARYYNPDQKRFVAEDSLELGGGDSNFYAYVGNDPVNRIDPSGNIAIVDDLIEAGIVIVVGGTVIYIGQALGKGLEQLRKLLHGLSCPLAAENGSSPHIDPNDVAGKSPQEIDDLAREKGLEPKGPDPVNGKGSYTDPVTGEQRILIHPNANDGPHAHVNNPMGQRLDVNSSVVSPNSPEAHLPIKYP
ncbi:RHS repeat domain-containing protein [Anthocerotibacter panamensis]|uniref:RHS repeat domain-containing protein n=1 Tax=Anthocerotibacter panamensis TaxID=2857077 RepID=UPI001C407E68|nr:RHS repeat-associated core domain-containing protein [Anthocerotibacter panamensis]